MNVERKVRKIITSEVYTMYVKPKILVLSISELKNIIKASACSQYACFDECFACTKAGWSTACDTYDSSKCDPFANVGAVHGSFN